MNDFKKIDLNWLEEVFIKFENQKNLSNEDKVKNIKFKKEEFEKNKRIDYLLNIVFLINHINEELIEISNWKYATFNILNKNNNYKFNIHSDNILNDSKFKNIELFINVILKENYINHYLKNIKTFSIENNDNIVNYLFKNLLNEKEFFLYLGDLNDN